MKSCILSSRICAAAGVLLSLCVVHAGTIDPNKPLNESLRPDILYFNFDDEDGGYVVSQAETGLSASLEAGKVDTPPVSRPGPGAGFGKAMEFNYGQNSEFAEDSNDSLMGNHLNIQDIPMLRLTGESFTLGAWIQVPEDARLPYRVYKKILSKGAFSDAYPGWALQISQKDNIWVLSLLFVDADNVYTRRDAVLSGFSPGLWHHVAASFDAESKAVTLWFDGNKVYSGEAPAGIGDSSRPLVIGESGMSSFGNIPLVLDDLFITSGVHDFIPVVR